MLPYMIMMNTALHFTVVCIIAINNCWKKHLADTQQRNAQKSPCFSRHVKWYKRFTRENETQPVIRNLFLKQNWADLCCLITSHVVQHQIKSYLWICKHRQIKKLKVGFGAGSWKFIKWFQTFVTASRSVMKLRQSAFGSTFWSRTDDKSWRTVLVKCHDHGTCTFEPAFVTNKLH